MESGSYLKVVKTGVTITTSGASASATLPTTQSGIPPNYVRVAASAAACVRLTKGASTALTTDLQVQPGDAVILAVNGEDTISAIQVSAAGVVQCSPLENL
jgi:hypothetical protein